jgi:hypothetical protein
MTTRRSVIAAIALAASALASLKPALAQGTQEPPKEADFLFVQSDPLVKEKEAQEWGIQAYIYAYPLVVMGQTRRVSTNVMADERQ